MSVVLDGDIARYGGKREVPLLQKGSEFSLVGRGEYMKVVFKKMTSKKLISGSIFER